MKIFISLTFLLAVASAVPTFWYRNKISTQEDNSEIHGGAIENGGTPIGTDGAFGVTAGKGSDNKEVERNDPKVNGLNAVQPSNGLDGVTGGSVKVQQKNINHAVVSATKNNVNDFGNTILIEDYEVGDAEIRDKQELQSHGANYEFDDKGLHGDDPMAFYGIHGDDPMAFYGMQGDDPKASDGNKNENQENDHSSSSSSSEESKSSDSSSSSEEGKSSDSSSSSSSEEGKGSDSSSSSSSEEGKGSDSSSSSSSEEGEENAEPDNGTNEPSISESTNDVGTQSVPVTDKQNTKKVIKPRKQVIQRKQHSVEDDDNSNGSDDTSDQSS